MLIIGILCLIISLTSFLVNLFAAFQGTTTTMKKIIVVQWIFALLLMVANEVMAIIDYLANTGNDNESYHQILGKTLLAIFIPVNILDILFWLWGLLTLTYENGDKIRDALMAKDSNPQYDYPSLDDDEGQI